MKLTKKNNHLLTNFQSMKIIRNLKYYSSIILFKLKKLIYLLLLTKIIKYPIECICVYKNFCLYLKINKIKNKNLVEIFKLCNFYFKNG